MFDLKIEYKGDWGKLKQAIAGAYSETLKREINKATKKNSLLILAEVKKRIMEKKYEKNAPWTLEDKESRGRGSTPLVDSGTMIKAMDQEKIDWSHYIVGFLEDQETGDGRTTLYKILKVLHDGATITQGKRTIRIPPRPFLRDVWEDPRMIAKINKNWDMAIRNTFRKIF